MKKIISILLILTFAVTAYAGFKGFNDDTELDVFDTIKCENGLTCKKVKGVFEMRTNEQQDSTSGMTLTSADCGSTILGKSDHIVNLPDGNGNTGCRLSFIIGDSSGISINPEDDEQILLLTNAAGDAIDSGTKGNSVVLEAFIDGSSGAWAPLGAEKGTFSDVD